MLRTANEMNTETKEAIEDFVMKRISTAAINKEYFVTFTLGDIPDWLCAKLINYGYMLTEDDDFLEISWEQLKDAE